MACLVTRQRKLVCGRYFLLPRAIIPSSRRILAIPLFEKLEKLRRKICLQPNRMQDCGWQYARYASSFPRVTGESLTSNERIQEPLSAPSQRLGISERLFRGSTEARV